MMRSVRRKGRKPLLPVAALPERGEPRVPRQPRRKLTIQFRHKDVWVLEELEKNIEVKSKMGINVSMNFEVVRLIKRGLAGDVL